MLFSGVALSDISNSFSVHKQFISYTVFQYYTRGKSWYYAIVNELLVIDNVPAQFLKHDSSYDGFINFANTLFEE